MRVKTARCPECGADVSFNHPASALVVCGYCRSALARTDVDVEKIGKVGMLADVPSLLSLGMRGTAYGGFSVVGRLQLDYGAGTWNEWHLGLDSGKWLWLAEAQGRYYLTAPVGIVEDAPGFEEAHLGRSVRLPSPDGGELVMHVSEQHSAKIVSAEGELPWRVDPGEPLHYVDLSGPRRSFGTLDYGDSPAAAPMAYVGRQVELAELGLKEGTGFEYTPPKQPSVKAARMECPDCHGALELRAPDQTLRVTCPYCAALVDVSEEPLRALAKLEQDRSIKPLFSLGSKAMVRGTLYTVLGYLRRRIDGSGFTWGEYVLGTGPGGPFHYLVEADGHFTLVRPAHLGDVHGAGSVRSHGGRTYHRVEQVRARVVHVDGEFPWEVEVGETALVEDFWAEGYLLSLERTEGTHAELVASEGEYLDGKELFAAFGLKGAPPRTTYVAPHQPNIYRGRLERQKRVLWPALAVLGLLMMIFAMRAGSIATTTRFALSTVPGLEPAAEFIFLSEPFTLGRGSRAAVTFELSAPTLQNSWIDADVALINDEDGTVHQFGAGVSYYSGVDAGEAWSEGSRRAEVLVPSVATGRYVLRVESSWPAVRSCSTSSDCGVFGACEAGKCRRSCGAFGPHCDAGELCQGDRCVLAAVPYTVTLRHGTARTGWGFFFALLILIVPLWTWIRRQGFEQRRQQDMHG